jgi:serine/threonine protein kinase
LCYLIGYDLLERFFELDYKKRITAAEALEHPFLAELHNPEDEVLSSLFNINANSPSCV